MRLAIVAALVAACSSGASPAPAPTPGAAASEVPAATPTAGAAPTAGAGPAAGAGPTASPTTTATASPIAGRRQLLLGLTAGWDSVAVELALYERATDDAAWTPVGAAWPAVLGREGTAWGRGLHGAAAPDGRAGPVKQEGDGKSPAGAFALGDAWGYAAAPLDGTRLAYHPSGAKARCVDDPASASYNAIVDDAGEGRDWSSAEVMRRQDELYRWLVVVDHNGGVSGAPTPGAGSCIFLHVWRRAGDGTAGCTAMARDRLEALLARLDPAARPAFVLLPREAHAALRSAWRLP